MTAVIPLPAADARPSFRRLARCILAFVWLAVGCGRTLAATTGVQSEYTVRAWQMEDGLPQNSVLAIAQTPDGYLWLATFNGLARFDGVQFTIFDPRNSPGLPSARIVALFVDHTGALWLTTENRALARLWRGQFRTFGAAEGVPDWGVQRVGEDGQGRLWMADPRAGLYRWQDNRFVPVLAPGGFGDGHIAQIFRDGEGLIWFKQGYRLARFQDGQCLILKDPGEAQETVVAVACPSLDGGFWVVTPTALRKYRHGQWSEESWPVAPFNSLLYGPAEDRFGNLWLTTFDNGVFRFDPRAGWTHFTVGTGLEHKGARCAFADREGNVWIGTDGGGLHRFTRRTFRTYGLAEGLPDNLVRSVAEDSTGRVWLAIKENHVGWLDEAAETVRYQPCGLTNLPSIRCLRPDRHGAVWLGTYNAGVCRLAGESPSSAATWFTDTAGARIGTVRDLFEDRAGGMWVAGDQGLSRFFEDKWSHFSAPEGLAHPVVLALAEDSHGNLFAGTAGGLHCFRDGRFAAFPRQEGLPEDTITALTVDAHDVLWIGTARSGLSRLKAGRFVHFGPTEGIPPGAINGIVADDREHLWLATPRGILRLRLSELDAVAEGRQRRLTCLPYSRADGLASAQCTDNYQPAVWKGRDGRLWFATTKGVAVVDPKAVSFNSNPPPVLIEQVVVDGTPVGNEKAEVGDQTSDARSGTDAPQPVTLGPRHERLEFHFTALSFAAPEKVHFRYRLEGFDGDWVEGGARREAVYTRLPAGAYRFQVTACNNDGVWNETGAALALTVPPPWWQAWWFRAGVLLCAGALMFGFYEWRIHLLKRRRAQQHEFSRRLIASQENERQRIATELHDGLGQHLLVIKNMAALGVRAAQDDPARAEKFTAISALASQAVGEVRQIARALRPFELDRLGLTKALTWLIKPAGDSSNIQFDVEVDKLDGVFPPEFEINLYRIVQESLANILKHSQATTARVQIKRESQQLLVTIQDNGHGFVAPTTDRAPAGGGMGLTDMAERVRIMGGQFSLESAPGAGTRLRILIPLPEPTRAPKPGT